MWVVDGRSRRDGNNRYRRESWIFLYAPKISHLSFIGSENLGLDLGPSFPVHGPVQLEAPALYHSLATASRAIGAARLGRPYFLSSLDTFVVCPGWLLSCPVVSHLTRARTRVESPIGVELAPTSLLIALARVQRIALHRTALRVESFLFRIYRSRILTSVFAYYNILTQHIGLSPSPRVRTYATDEPS
ncbi:hypothetical protein BGY98DRAFT_234323 [Russula aff. rugulosa BPL654]|nr:hypothetical protein BGY98DRAFT_234323 [Russula aff. rugulosa BPL654]